MLTNFLLPFLCKFLTSSFEFIYMAFSHIFLAQTTNYPGSNAFQSERDERTIRSVCHLFTNAHAGIAGIA